MACFILDLCYIMASAISWNACFFIAELDSCVQVTKHDPDLWKSLLRVLFQEPGIMSLSLNWIGVTHWRVCGRL